MKKNTLIIPCLTERLDIEFGYSKDDCCINCVKAISEIDINVFDEILFVILSKMDNEYRLTEKITADMARFENCRPNIKIIKLTGMTSSPAETIYHALSTVGFEDRSIYIKDADNMYSNRHALYGNEIMVASLEDQDIIDPKHKSYVQLDEQGFITNAIEHHVISDKFIAGGYSFADAEMFKDAYEALKTITNKFYISDIVFWLILNKDIQFRPVTAKDFKDFNI